MSQVSDTKSKNQENDWKDSAARAEEFDWSKDEDNLRELGLKRSRKREESTFFVTHLHKLTELTTSTFATRDGRVRRCMGEWCIHSSMIFGYGFEMKPGLDAEPPMRRGLFTPNECGAH